MAAETLRLSGYREFLRACDQGPRDTRREVRTTFREVGQIVEVEAADRMRPIDAKSAANYRTAVRQRGVSVEQRLGKTTGAHPEFGALQMREALIPALVAKEDDVEGAMEDAIDRVADRFER